MGFSSLAWALMALWFGVADASAAQPPDPAPQGAPQARKPKVALVLAGGGAKGIAHVGVIKVVEEAGIQVDVVVGTSMGAIVGGLYAMGTDAKSLEALVRSVDWNSLFIDETPRQDLTIRRKADDVGFLSDARLRVRDGQPGLPQGAIKGQRLSLMLQDMTRPAAAVTDFDKLPRPYRAVAADIGTGEEVVLGSGSLAMAMRASMSVPAAFPPVEIGGRTLVDGGIVNNVPISVARSMGADIIIVSGFASQIKKPEELTSAVAILNQSIDLMMARTTKAQLATLGPSDVLIVSDMGDIGAGSFERSLETLPIGEAAARAQFARLAQVGKALVPHPRTVATLVDRPTGPIGAIRFENTTKIDDAVLLRRMKSRPGQPIDTAQLDKDMSGIYGLGLFQTVSYRIEQEGGQNVVVVLAEEHPTGKDYLRFGAKLTNDFNGESTYDFGVSFTKSAMNRLNGEWRTQATLGQTMALYTEWYQPLDLDGRFHVKPSVYVGERTVNLFDDDRKIAEARVAEFRGELLAGFNLNDDLVLFTAFGGGYGRVKEKTGSGNVPSNNFSTARLSAGFAYDTLDNLNFPRHGVLAIGRYSWSDNAIGADDEFQTTQLSVNAAMSWGKNTVVVGGLANLSWDGVPSTADLYDLGGPFRLSGVPERGVTGGQALLARVIYYREISSFGPSFINVPLYAGFSVEYGNVFDRMDDIDLDDMRVGGSVFIGLDSFIGPILLGFGITEDGSEAVYLAVGSIF